MLSVAATLAHPDRRSLNDEVHARPPDSLPTPSSLIYLARLPARDDSDRATGLLAELLEHFDSPPPTAGANHYATTIAGRRLRWERHTEYDRYTIVSSGESGTADIDLPEEWLGRMQGEILVALKARVVGKDDCGESIEGLSGKYFDGNILIGARVADDDALALTDFRIHDDGFGRVLLVDCGMSEPQTGRVMQRLLEIETYRMLTLLALPVAQRLAPVLAGEEAEMAAIGEALLAVEAHQEQALLDRLTQLSASSQSRQVRSAFRFAAAEAYYDIVLTRIAELRETRIHGMQTFEEFTTRRLTPAVKTCRAVSRRQQTILEQMARATKLLSTRIDVARQQQHESLLASMNRRVKAQLRLQATVEGLSVAAVTYYVVGLVGAIAEGLETKGLDVEPALVMAASVPVVAGLVFFTVRRLRRKISREEGG